MTEYSKVDKIQIMGTVKSKNGNTEVVMVREHFEEIIPKLLDSIWGSQTGGAVLRALDAQPGFVFIVPRPGAQGDVVMNSEEKGQGLVSTIPFEPEAWPSQPNTLNACEVLLHELVHSVRQLSRVHIDLQPTHDAYESLEEFYSIVVGNVYRSELGRIGLRGGHGFESLPPKQRDSAAVFLNTAENRKRLEKLKRENADLFNSLSNILSVKWNPFAVMSNPRAKK